jgi:twitching motility two-component system response regulator PilG
MPLPSQRPSLLTVDDSITIQEIIKQAMAEDFNVLVANNAEEALFQIYHQPIAILLLDVSMPGVNGLELCRTLRSLPQFEDLPIIMLTAKDKVFDKVQGRLAGATEYLTKPFDTEELGEICKRLLGLKSSTTAKT